MNEKRFMVIREYLSNYGKGQIAQIYIDSLIASGFKVIDSHIIENESDSMFEIIIVLVRQ